MNTPNPLIPQGSLLEQQQRYKGKSNLVIAVFTIAAIHIVLFGGLLMNGCKKKSDTETAGTEETNQFPQLDQGAPLSEYYSESPSGEEGRTGAVQTGGTSSTGMTDYADTNYSTQPGQYSQSPTGRTQPAAQTNVSSTSSRSTSTGTPSTRTTNATSSGTAETVGTEYTIVKGDTLFEIAQAHGISLSSLREANPNVNPQRLRIGQTITIPPPSAEEQGPVAGEGESVYEVQPGDNLTKISREYGTTIDAIKEANNLRTDRINVGQKLVIPSSADNGN